MQPATKYKSFFIDILVRLMIYSNIFLRNAPLHQNLKMCLIRTAHPRSYCTFSFIGYTVHSLYRADNGLGIEMLKFGMHVNWETF